MAISIHILSDLHLEFSSYTPTIQADITVLAGDIYVGTKGLAWARECFPNSEIIYVAGNHEFYHHNYQILLEQFRSEAEQYDIHFLEKNEIILDGIRFLGCTLWTDYKCFEGLSQVAAMDNIGYRLADHRLIQTADKNGQFGYFSTHHARQVHTDSVSWLTQKLFDESFDGKTVVVSHHGPSLACEHEFFGHTDFAPAFYSDLPNLMAKTDLWIYGHTHSNLDVYINNTRLISNQKGYPNERISGFNENLKIFLYCWCADSAIGCYIIEVNHFSITDSGNLQKFTE